MLSKVRAPHAGRYRVLRELSSTPESRVFLAEDARQGRRCVLKIRRVPGPTAFESARREFEVLRKLEHPGIAEVYDFGRMSTSELNGADHDPTMLKELASLDLGGEPLAYIAGAYYEGLDLREAFLRLFPEPRLADEETTAPHAAVDAAAPNDQRAWRVFLEAVARICDALGAIHSRGLIHYDIKPENIVLIPRLAGEKVTSFDVKILDFGLSEEDTTPLGTRVRGTIPFIAPECLESPNASQRSDLFSLGVTIAFAVTGRFPFPGTRPERWLEAARKGRIVDLRRIRPDMPEGLAALIEDLLQPAPQDRPSTAIEALSRVEKAGGFQLPFHRRSSPRMFPRVGWERELALVRGHVESLHRGEATKAIIILEGDADQFLDQLLDEAEVLARVEGSCSVSGSSCLPRRYTYQPFAEIVEKLSEELDLTSPRFERFASTLAAFAPIEISAESIRKTTLPLLKPRLEVYRFLDLASQFFLEVARDAPLVLCIRDLHLAGKECIDLLKTLARNVHLSHQRLEGADSEHEPAKLLILGTLRDPRADGDAETAGTGGADTLSELLAEPYTERIRLEGLGLDRVAAWIHERAPHLRIEGEVVRRLHEKSGGSPWLIDEFIARAERKAGAGNETPLGREEAADPEILLRLPRKAEEAACERVEALSTAERRILEVLSAAHGWLLRDEIDAVLKAAEEVERDGADVMHRIERLRDLGFIEVRDEAPRARVQLRHPGLAGQIYRQMREDVRALVHRRIAWALLERSSTGGPSRAPEDIAFHARLGGLNGLYFKQALIAAEKLAAARACEAAMQLYEEVLERLGACPAIEPGTASLPLEPDLLRRQVNERLAALYLGRGHLHKAIEKLTLLSSTHDILPESRDLGAVYRTMGEVYQQNGDPANAAYFLEKSLKLCMSRLPDSSPPDGQTTAPSERHTGECLLTLLAVARHHLGRESLEESEKLLKECIARAGASDAQRESRSRAHALLAEIESRRGSHSRALVENLEALKLAEDAASLPLLLETLSSVGWSYLSRGEYDKAVEYFERGLEAARKLESKFDVAVLQSSLGTLHHTRADHQKALECFTRSLLLNSQIGDLKGIANSYNNLGIVRRLKDELSQASECYKRAIDLFSRINDQGGMATGMNNLSSILELEGKYNEALDYSFRALDKRKKSRSRSGMAFSYYRIGKIYQAKGEIDKAINYAEKSLEIRAELGEKLGMAYSRLLLAELCLGQGKHADSLQLCEAGLKDFQDLDNEVGVLLAQETLARILLRLGDLEKAGEILKGVHERSKEIEQPMLTGSCLLHLARVAVEAGSSREAEGLLIEAERLFRSRQNRRELAEVLLEICTLKLEAGHAQEAAKRLEEAYSSLEELGIRDLVPHYFLLRGRMAGSDGPGADKDAGRKFLERGLVEAHELNLPDLQWRLHFHMGLHDARQGDLKLARIHFQEAKDLLDEAHAGLPPRFRETFFRIRERQEPARRVASPSSESRQELPAPKKSDTDSLKLAPSGPLRGFDVDEVLLLHQETLKLHKVTAAMGNEKDLKKLLESVMDAVLALVDAERGFVILKDASGEADGAASPKARTITVARNLDREEILEPEGKVSHSVAGEVLRTGEHVLARNAISEPRFLSSKSVRELRLRSLVCVPLRFRNEILGAIYLDNRHRRDAFQEEDLKLLQAFADQAAVAVKNARLIEENLKRTGELLAANSEMESLNVKLRRTVHKQSAQLAIAREDLRDRQSQLEARYHFQNLVGKSEAMQEIFFLLEKISATQLPVLLEGESGTGKELIARAIHFNGLQREARFVSQNCGALTESLLETELFGHTRGAFTGAVSDKKGLFELANNGTLFLDEVGDMSLGMQQKLLRVLQEGEIRRVGGKDIVRVSVRIISSSNKDLLDLVSRGLFREDLYYRINGIRIQVPSLRERREDIPLLVEHFVQTEQKAGEPVRRFQPEAIRAIVERDWPGNVRELRHFVERTLLIASDNWIREEDLLFDAPRPGRGGDSNRSTGSRGQAASGGTDVDRPRGFGKESRPPGAVGSLKDARSVFEREFLAACLNENRGNVAAAARRCQISRESFYRLLRKYKLDPR